jgi:hypothetical protein
MPLLIPPETPELAVQRLHQHLAEAGRESSSMQLMPRVYPLRRNPDGTPADYIGLARFWQSSGAENITVHTNTVDPEMKPSEILQSAIDAKKVLEQEIG